MQRWVRVRSVKGDQSWNVLLLCSVSVSSDVAYLGALRWDWSGLKRAQCMAVVIVLEEVNVYNP
jgi:hypothetical protein